MTTPLPQRSGAFDGAVVDSNVIGPEVLHEAHAARIYLARHGETALNAAGVLRGRLDPSLNAVGLRQAAELGEDLAHRGVQLVVASPLHRAIDTARAVAARVDLVVEVDPRLSDRDYGPWAGHSREEASERWGSIDNAPGVEASAHVQVRAMAALEEIAVRLSAGAAVIVSHDAVNQLLLRAIDPHLVNSVSLPQETGCYNVLQRDVRGWTVLSINNIPTQMKP